MACEAIFRVSDISKSEDEKKKTDHKSKILKIFGYVHYLKAEPKSRRGKCRGLPFSLRMEREERAFRSTKQITSIFA